MYGVIMYMKKFWEIMRLVFVMLVLFFGATFAIMTFHEDVAVIDMIDRLYVILGNEGIKGYHLFEWAYSIGIFLGVLVFFGKIKIRGDNVTPVEMKLWQYQKDVEAYHKRDYDDCEGD